MTQKLTTKHDRALTSLLAGDDLKDAARAAGVQKRTIYRWLEKPTFYNELQRRKKKAIGAASIRLAGGMDAAISVMQRIMNDKDVAPSIQLRAAHYYMVHEHRISELQDVIERIDAIEQRLGKA